MKGATGLIVAVVLGVCAAVLNWVYLEQTLGNRKDDVAFLGIADRGPVTKGTRFEDRHFQAVTVPGRQAEVLKKYAILYDSRASAIGIAAIRDYQPGDLLLTQDVRTPTPELRLEPGESIVWVQVNSGGFVPSLINPGDQIMFLVRKVGPTIATDADGQPTTVAAPPRRGDTGSGFEEIGPFRVKSLGERLDRMDVSRASRSSSGQEKQVGIVVNAENAEQARKLTEATLSGESRSIAIKLIAKGV